MEYNIFNVGSAQFSMFKMLEKALIFDCGYTKGNWIWKKNFIEDKLNLLTAIFEGIKKVVIMISHRHGDHYNLIFYLKKFFKEKKNKIYLY